MKTAVLNRLVYLTIAFVTFGNLVGTFAQEREMGGVGMTVFEERDFRGKSATYTNNVANLANTEFNDRISSLKVGRGERWEICKDANYQGRCVVVSGEEKDLRNNSWNNMISSFRRIGGGTPVPVPQQPYIVLYSQANYRGTVTNQSGEASYLNRTAQSVTIGRGIWQFCEGTNFTGRCVTIDVSVPNLSTYNLSRRISSARPVDTMQPEPPGADWYIVLFSQANYRGTPSNYKNSQSRISKSTGSITIGKGVWEVCTGSGFTGRCEMLSNSVSNMTFFGISRTIRSVRPVLPQPR